jgi:hypothetical protein
MDLLTIITIASKVMEVAVAIAQDGRQKATAQEIAQVRALTQTDVSLIEQDANTPSLPSSGS